MTYNRLALPVAVYRIPLVRALMAATVWRWLEKQSGRDTTGPTTKSAPDYNYGKVTGLSPDLLIMTETTESPYVCCGYCTAGMACNVVKPSLSDKMSSTAHPIRSHGGRPHNNGNNASELRTGTKEAHSITLKSIAISEIKERLSDGYAVTVGLQYAELPGYLKVQGGDFGHACCLYGIQHRDDDDRVGFFDPLWPQGARGAWAKWADVKAALWGDGNHSTTTVRYVDPDTAGDCPDCPPVPQYSGAVNTEYVEALAVAVNQQALLTEMYHWVGNQDSVPPFPLGDALAIVPNQPWSVGKWNQTTWYQRPPDPNGARWDTSTWAGVAPIEGGTWA
jgi:hypothetical protein